MFRSEEKMIFLRSRGTAPARPGRPLAFARPLVIVFLILTSVFGLGREAPARTDQEAVRRTIFVYGNGMERAFIRYVIELTGKDKPKVCFLPTAAGDDHRVVGYIDALCKGLPLETSIMMTFISSSPGQKSFEEQILGSDAVIVGGGNTLNMLAIWKAQGIDASLRKAYDRGIVLAGGSAGSLCWFTGGYTDSRPKELSLMTCLGFLDYSHSPHYNDGTARKQLYRDAVLKGALPPGYACDNGAGLLFVDGRLAEAVTLDPKSQSYYVHAEDGKLEEDPLPAKLVK
jgi:dipeptidase E